jgi:hypothetical protein
MRDVANRLNLPGDVPSTRTHNFATWVSHLPAVNRCRLFPLQRTAAGLGLLVRVLGMNVSPNWDPGQSPPKAKIGRGLFISPVYSASSGLTRLRGPARVADFGFALPSQEKHSE